MTALRMQAVLLAGFSILVFGAPFDFCDIGRAIANKSLTSANAIKGLHLTAVVPYFHLFTGPDNNAAQVKCPLNAPPGAIMNTNCTGYVKIALDEAARVAGFTYDLFTVDVEQWNQATYYNGSVTEWLKKYGAGYDIVLASLADTSQRRDAGFLNPFSLLDSSPRLITKIMKAEVSQWDKMTTFTQPFSGDLWLLIAVVAVSTAFFMWWFESPRVDGDCRTSVRKGAGDLVECVWLALCQFTGGANYEPVTVPGRLAFFSWSFFILIVVAAYTANLAAFLTVKGSAGTGLLVSFADAKNKRAKICVPMKTALGPMMSTWGEGGVPFVDTSGMKSASVREKLESGECQGLAAEGNAGETMLVDKMFNDDCGYGFVGDRLREASTGVTMYFPGTNCASVLFNTLGNAFKILYEDGTLAKAIEKSMVEVNTLTQQCGDTATDTGTDKDSLKLSVNSMIGIFGVHGILVAFAALLSFSSAASERLRRLRAKKPKGEEIQLEVADERVMHEDTTADLKTELHVLHKEMRAELSAIGTKQAEIQDLITERLTLATHSTVHGSMPDAKQHGPMILDVKQDCPMIPTQAEYQTLVTLLKKSEQREEDMMAMMQKNEQREEEMMAMMRMLSDKAAATPRVWLAGNGGTVAVRPSSPKRERLGEPQERG